MTAPQYRWNLGSDARAGFSSGAQDAFAGDMLSSVEERFEVRPGDSLGPYRLVSLLGQGGMGAVFSAQSPSGERVALKVLLPTSATKPHQEDRFRREGQLVASLDHPGIVRLRDSGEAGRTPYLVYELVEGALSFEEAIGRSSRRRRLELILEVADAVAHAHESGITHRDLKPANILVADHRVLVTDFGLALRDDLERLTASGAWVGTPHYMAPEQFGGKKGRQGPPTDVWALGVLLYEALTDDHPFPAFSLIELATQVAEAKPAPPSSYDPTIPARVEQVCLRALSRDPQDRYPDAGQFRAALEGAMQALPAEPSNGTIRWVVAGSAAAVVAAVGLILWSLTPARVEGSGSTDAVVSQRPTPAATTLTTPEPTAPPTTVTPVEVAPPPPPPSPEERARADALLESATAHLEKGEIDAGLRDCDEAIRLYPGWASLWLARARALVALYDYEGALEAATQAVSLNPRYSDAWHMKGQIRQKRGDPAGALEDSARAIETNPTRADYWALRGLLLGKLARPDEALEALSYAANLDPTNPLPYHNRALVLGGQADWAGVRRDVDRAIELDPYYGSAWNLRGYLNMQEDRPAEARSDLTRAAELVPHDPKIRINLGIAEETLGNLLEAGAHYTLALEMRSTEFTLAYYHRGKLRLRLSDMEGARADLEQVVKGTLPQRFRSEAQQLLKQIGD